jgi:ABC-type multidrug transport system ATPase subunit
MRDFRNRMREKMALLRVDEGFASRYVNEGFSGGEKKRLEMLQMAVLEPEMAILDETDSGLDIDALRIVAEGVNAMLNPELGVLLITHYQRLLNYIQPDVVHVLALGRIVKTGGKDLALRLEEEGYGPIMREAGLAVDTPDEALLVPKGPELELEHAGEAVEAAREPGGCGAWPSRRHRRDRADSIRSRCDATSRSSTRRSTATGSCISTRRRRARSLAS